MMLLVMRDDDGSPTQNAELFIGTLRGVRGRGVRGLYLKALLWALRAPYPPSPTPLRVPMNFWRQSHDDGRKLQGAFAQREMYL